MDFFGRILSGYYVHVSRATKKDYNYIIKCSKN